MTDTGRAYFDSVFSMAGEPGQRVRHFAGRVREDVRTGAERLRGDFRSGAEQFRSQGSRTLTDIGSLIRAEIDAGLTRMGVATQTDLDDVNLRLEHYEEELRDLRTRLAEAEAKAEKRSPVPVAAEPAEQPEAPTDEEQP